MSPKRTKMKQLFIDGSLRNVDGGNQDETSEESVNLLQAIDCLEKEAAKMYTDISRLQTKLSNIKSIKVTRDPAKMENYSIKLNHKFYEFTGVSIKHVFNNTITVFYYIKHDDWASNIKPYWVKIETGDDPKVISYDLPFMVDMKEIEAKNPISDNFVDYIRRCIESYFERRQQAHELEKVLNPALANVTMNMKYTLVQVKLFARKSAPERRFSIWYREDATLPHKYVVRITDDGHEELIRNLTLALIVLNTKPLPEAFVEGTQEYLDESSSEESLSQSEVADAPDLEPWFYLPASAPRKKPKGGNRRVAWKEVSEHYDEAGEVSVTRPSPETRAKGGDDRVAKRKRVDTPSKYETVNWRRDEERNFTRAEGVKTKSVERRKSKNSLGARDPVKKSVNNLAVKIKNSSVERRRAKRSVDARKSLYLDLSELSERNSQRPEVSRGATQSVITNFLRPINVAGPSEKTSKPRERNVPPLVYENDFGFEDGDSWSLHSAETLPRREDGDSWSLHSAETLPRRSLAVQ